VRLEPLRLLRERQTLELAVRFVKDDRGGSFVDLARLDAHEPILDLIDAPHAVLATQLVQARNQGYTVQRLSVQTRRPALLEADLDDRGRVGRVCDVARP
jgi:hypothetical protein